MTYPALAATVAAVGMRLKAAVAPKVSMAVPVPLGPDPTAGTAMGTAFAGGASTLSTKFTYACRA